MSKSFKVASVSSNHNSFGLRGMILVAQDGEAWEVAANDINVGKKGDVVSVPYNTIFPNEPDFSGRGYEIPHRLQPDAPAGVVKEIWG